MYYTIYRITNNINGKYYIGMHKTKDLEDNYMGSGKYLKRAIEKHGVENFSKEILYVYDNESDMKNKEKELVIVSEQTYNLNEGGYGGFSFINRNKMNNGRRSEESEKRRLKSLSETRKLMMKDEKEIIHMKTISKIGREKVKQIYPEGTWKNRKHKQESIDKMKEKHKNNGHQKGSKNSQYGTCWITNGKENKKIKTEDIDKYLNLGYTKGRILNMEKK